MMKSQKLNNRDKALIKKLHHQGIGYRTIAKILDNKVSFQAIARYDKQRKKELVQELLERIEGLEKSFSQYWGTK